MPNQQIVDYVKKMREAGYGDCDIRALLLNAGHREGDIRIAFDAVDRKAVVEGGIITPLPDYQPITSNFKKIKKIIFIVLSAIGLFVVAAIGFIFLIPQSHYGDRDTARVANMESVRAYLEIYNTKCGHYPGVADIIPECSSPTANNNWIELTKAMSAAGISSRFPNDSIPGRNYFYGVGAPDDLRFVVGATFERDNNKLRNDVDGIIYGVDCNDPVYCVSND
jgi:hypothetical protein